MTTALVVAAACLLLEAFFAASELAIISSDRVAIRKAAGEGHRSAQLVEAFLEDKQRLLATTLFGTQATVVVSTVVMTYALHHYHRDRAELYLLLGLTPAIVVLGEIVPKSLGQQLAHRLARRLVYPLWWSSVLFAPAVWTLSRFVDFVTRVSGLPERKIVSREDLEALLRRPATGQRSGMTEGERKMISRIFAFTDKTVDGVMEPLANVIALDEGSDIAEASREIERTQYTRFPVYRDRVDHIVGTVHAFDVLKAGRSNRRLAEIARAPIFAPPNQPAIDLLLELQRARQGMAIVVDEYGGAVGIATVEDILEEVVGDIEDEHDEDPAAIRRESEGVWRVSGRVSVREVNRELRVGLPEGEDYESVAGLVLDRLRHIPREGETIRFGPVTVRVTKASQRTVEEVQIRLGRRKPTLTGARGA